MTNTATSLQNVQASAFIAKLLNATTLPDTDFQETPSFPVSASDRMFNSTRIGLTPNQMKTQFIKIIDEERQKSYDNGYDQGLIDTQDNE